MLQLFHLLGGIGEPARRLIQIGIDLDETFGVQLPFHLESAELHEQRLFLRREVVSFLLQREDALARTLGQSLDSTPLGIRRLRTGWERKRGQQGRQDRDREPSDEGNTRPWVLALTLHLAFAGSFSFSTGCFAQTLPWSSEL